MVSRDELREMVRRLEKELKEETRARDKKVFTIASLLLLLVKLSVIVKLSFQLNKTRTLLEDRRNLLMTVSCCSLIQDKQSNDIGEDQKLTFPEIVSTTL